MTGKTHLAVGNAAALLITQPKTIDDFILCVGASLVGAVISDIDIKGSGSRKILNRILFILSLAFLLLIFVKFKWKFGIYSSPSAGFIRMLMGGLMLLVICIYGKDKPHRSFMHSLLGILLSTVAVNIMMPEATIYFCISMASHIIIDMMNYKKVNIFYPGKTGISLSICKSDGIFNTVLFYIAITLCFIYILFIR